MTTMVTQRQGTSSLHNTTELFLAHELDDIYTFV